MQGNRGGINARSRPVKILFLIDELNVGGTEKQLLWLCENLPRSRFSPLIGVLRQTAFQQGLSLETPIIDFKWQGAPLVKNLQLMGRLRRYFLEEKIDIVQTQFVESEIYGSLATLSCRKRPVLISTRRNLYHWISEDPWRFRIGRQLTRYVDKVLVNSESVFERCRDLEGVLPGRLALIQNAVDLTIFANNDKDKGKVTLGLSPEQIVVGIVGNWRPVKGLVCFMEAAARIADQISGVQFVLAGSGPQEAELKGLARKFAIQDQTFFFKAYPNIPELISSFDIAVQSSFSESFPNVVVEYMAASKPIVATTVGDTESILEHNKCGLLVRPNSADELASSIMELCTDKKRAEEMGNLARERVVANWSSEKILHKYNQFYEQLVIGVESANGT